jgi:hypothetical protein
MKNIKNFKQFNESRKIDSDAKIRNRGNVVFPAGSEKVLDKKDHFPINTENQARNALSRASQYDKVPEWYDGTLEELVKKVHNKIKTEYPDIDITEKSKKPGKN